MTDAEVLQIYEDLKAEARNADLEVKLDLIRGLIDITNGSTGRSFESVGEALAYVFGWADGVS